MTDYYPWFCILFYFYILYGGSGNQQSRSARQQQKIQEIQQRLNIFVANKGRRKTQNLSGYKKSETTKRLDTTSFESGDVPYYKKTDDKKLLLMEELPEILEGIKMTTTMAQTTTGIKKVLLF